MDKYVWLFPVIFMLHEMEEIIGFKFWLAQNENMLKEKYPKIAKEYEGHSTEGFALAVAEEYIICLLICVLSIITGRYGLWFGGFIAYAIHLAVHIIQSAVIKKYIPALATSILTLPISIYFIVKSYGVLGYSALEAVVYSIIGIAVIGGNLKLVHRLMKRFTKLTESFTRK